MGWENAWSKTTTAALEAEGRGQRTEDRGQNTDDGG